MSRQKLVFPTSEVFHLWANQTQPEARNSQGNVFFEGTSIYSYGRYFKLAEIHPEQDAVIFNSNGYSNTTAKHKHKCRMAIDKWKYFNHFSIPDCDIFKAGEYFLSEIESNLKQAITAKSKKESLIWAAKVNVESAKHLNDLFPGEMFIPAQLQHYFDNPVELTPEQIAAHKQQQKLIRDRKKQQQLELEKENEEKIQEWINFERRDIPYKIDKVYLREHSNSEGHFVETSKGATVPYREAKILFRELQQQPPTLGKYLDGKIGNYQIHHLRNNVLTIGCHHITMEEVNRFAASQGWITNSIEPYSSSFLNKLEEHNN